MALKPLPHLLGAVSIPFFKPAGLPWLENQFRVNPFLQTTPVWLEAPPVLNFFTLLDLRLTCQVLPGNG